MTDRIRAVMALAAATLLITGTSAAQVVVTQGGGAPASAPRAPGTSAVSGVVRDGTTGQPLAGAVVALTTHPRFRSQAVDRMATDGLGRFVFTKLAAGEYYVHVGRIGYFDGGYGRDRPGEETGAAVVLADGQWFDRADVVIWKPGAIIGLVLDELGEPIVGVPVRALPLIRIAGSEHVAAGIITTTDDRGAYRLTGLGPGRYLVQVPSVQAAVPAGTTPFELLGMTRASYDNAVRGGRAPALPAPIGVDDQMALAVGQYLTPPGAARAYPPTLYPSARTIGDAVAVQPTYGRDTSGIDIHLSAVATARVSGRIIGAPDQLAGLLLRLVPPGSEGLAFGGEAATATAGPGGTFTFVNVPLGAYTLMAGRSLMQYHFAPLGNNVDATLPNAPGFDGGGMGAGSLPSAAPGIGYNYVRSKLDDTAWAQVPVSVEAGGLDNLVVELRPTVSVRGRVVWEGGEPDPPISTRMTPTGRVTGRADFLPVFADPADGHPALGLPRGEYRIATQEFEIGGLKVGQYLLRIQGAPLIRSVVWNGQDLTSAGFDASLGHDFNDVVVTVTDRLASISGIVRNDDGQTVAGSTVLAFPTDRALWARFGFVPDRLRASETDSSGSYALTLPAGQYFLTAVGTLPAEGWRHAAFLAQAGANAQTIRVDWSDVRTQDLAVRTIR